MRGVWDMLQFVDREREMEAFQREFARDGASLVILYGRRRVGKTTLISKFIKDKKAMFFLASEESEAQNRAAFKDRAADFIDSDLLRDANVSSWDAIFEAILNTPFEAKPVIVIDEFQYIGRSSPAFPSVFLRIWEEQLKNKDVMVVLCGSLVSMMVSQTLAYSSPLYGRRTAQIRLGPIPFKYYHAFFPNHDRRQLIDMYAVTGGVPKYIEAFLESLYWGRSDIYEIIHECILDRSGYLYDEPSFLLQKEVAEIGSYFSLIKAIAAGNRKLSAIASALGIKAAGVTKYLKTLIDLDILERETPVTEEAPEKSKKGLYKIKDNYIRFWFAFIFPNQSLIESGNEQVVTRKIKNGFVSNHAAFVYEDICREKMWDMNAAGDWPFHFLKLGRYWNGDTEIDIAALDPEGGNLILGECKYWTEPVGANILRELEAKAVSVPWRKGSRQTWYILFSVNGFTEELRELVKCREEVILAM
jgi:AAA+ ATPase superfamily predicted ATPase